MLDRNNKKIYQMLKISKSVLKAEKMMNKSLDYYREEILDEGAYILSNNIKEKLITFGVKNTNQIGKELVEVLRNNGFLFHTLDKMSRGGRAIDVDLINPLTGKVMTGSSSGSCVNILLGINDFALGTDGGGSVIGPAMSTNLYGIMAKGLGLKGSENKISTDNIIFTSGIGVISHNYNLCVDAIKSLVPINVYHNEELEDKNIKIAIPKKNSIILPTGKDIREELEDTINQLKNTVEFIEKDFSKIYNRKDAISLCEEIFSEGIDMIMTLEGPVDLLGVGDSVLGNLGHVGRVLQDNSGKYLLKVANMINSTSVTIPINELGMGILLIGKEGLESGSIAISLGNIIKDKISLSSLFERYFINSYLREEQGYI